MNRQLLVFEFFEGSAWNKPLMPVRCLETYTIAKEKLLRRLLKDILQEDYHFDFSKEEFSSFSVQEGFLYHNTHKVKEVAENTVFIHGSRMFVVNEELEIYGLPSLGRLVSSYGNNVFEYKERRLVLNGYSVDWKANVNRIVMHKNLLYVCGDKAITVMDHTLGILKTIPSLHCCHSSGNFIIKNVKDIFLNAEGDEYILPKTSEEYHILDFEMLEKYLYVWTVDENCSGRYLNKRMYSTGSGFSLGLDNKMDYSKDSEVLLQIQDISVRKSAAISSPTRVHHKIIRDKVLLLITTMNEVYMEYDGWIASKPHGQDIYEIDMNGYEAFGLASTVDVFDLYLTLQILVDLPAEFGMQNKIERFLFRVFVFSDKGGVLVSKLVSCGMDKSMEMILCRLYRKVDDNGKILLSPFVQNIQSIEALKLIIIYFPNEIERYIQLCISSEKEYEIEEVIEHYKGSRDLEDISRILLNNNCFYLFCLCKPEYEAQFKTLVLVEKYNTRSQRGFWKIKEIA